MTDSVTSPAPVAPGQTPAPAAPAPSVFDPFFIQTEEPNAAGPPAFTVRTSRLLVLTQETMPPLAPGIEVSTTSDTTIYGDVVRVVGTIAAPGRTIRIVCRQLEFLPGTFPSSIDVSGTRGSDGKASSQLAATKGADGTPVQRAGANGTKGSDDDTAGKAGGDAGAIEIHCTVLKLNGPLALIARGGRGGDGAKGQDGGGGGHGAGFSSPNEQQESHGGDGGLGGNGGDGGAGGKAGNVTLYCMTLLGSPVGSQMITVYVTGGDGGTGGDPGNGGDGGNGGDADQGPHLGIYAMEGAVGGGGAACGFPGYGGPVGAWGTLCCGTTVPRLLPPNWPPSYHALEDVLLHHPEQRADLGLPRPGADGKAPHGAHDQDRPPGWGRPGSQGRHTGASWRDAHQNYESIHREDVFHEPKAARGQSPVELPGIDRFIQGVDEFSYTQLATYADPEHLAMVFDHARTRYLLTSPQTTSGNGTPADDPVHDLLELLQWLLLVAGAKTGDTLAPSVTAMLGHLRLGCNFFGQDAQFAVLGSLSKYQTALTTMITLFGPVDAVYKQVSTTLNQAAEWQTYLGSVTKSQGSLLDHLEHSETAKRKELESVLTDITSVESSRLNCASSLSDSIRRLGDDVRKDNGLSGDGSDFFNLFNQLSFTNTENPVLGGAGLLSQVGDLTIKANENVASETGDPLNKKYVVRRMEFLDKDIKDVAALQQTRDGLLKADPGAECRLQATRDQVETICSNFYDKYPEARTISETLDQYIEAVVTRNEKVDEYNHLLSDIAYLQGESAKARAQQAAAQTAIQRNAQPGLPALAAFSRALRRHAWEQCVKELYMASRVYTMQSLDLYDVFADVLGKLGNPESGDLDATALNVGLMDIIAHSLTNKPKRRSDTQIFTPMGVHCVKTLTPKDSPLVFAALKAHAKGHFRILPADSLTTIDRNPFAGKAEVRLTHIRCIAQGMKTTDNVHQINLRHPGSETFVRADGGQLHLHHTDHKVSYSDLVTNQTRADGALDQDHNMIGPFCEWEIEIPVADNAGLDVTGLDSITIEFEGTFRPFVDTSS